MKLGSKLIILFGLGFAVIIAFLALGLPRVVASVTETQLKALARTVGAYLVYDLSTLPYGGDEKAFEKTIDRRFEFVAALGASTGNYRVNKIILINSNFRVEVGHPDGEIGADYSSHADIRGAFGANNLAVVLEAATGAGAAGAAGASGAAASGGRVEADIVAPLLLADGDERVLEVKLDFSATIALLGAQYARVLLIAAAGVFVSLCLLMGILLMSVRNTIIKPLLAVSAAMEEVGEGRLDARVEVRGRDEIAAMGRHFNSMTRGLRERFELERYVSRSTVETARARAGGPGSDPARGAKTAATGTERVERKTLAVFFSDVRGFTSYSERTDPARVVEVLNTLLGAQERIIDSRSGYVDKFVGDETMAIFERAEDAVLAAIAIKEGIAAMSDEIDGLAVGIGIHLGELVEGDIGSPRMMNHTVIGDTVNIAARLQAMAGPGQIIVSASVADDLAVAGRFAMRDLGPLRVKGKGQPIDCRELLGPRP